MSSLGEGRKDGKEEKTARYVVPVAHLDASPTLWEMTAGHLTSGCIPGARCCLLQNLHTDLRAAGTAGRARLRLMEGTEQLAYPWKMEIYSREEW